MHPLDLTYPPRSVHSVEQAYVIYSSAKVSEPENVTQDDLARKSGVTCTLNVFASRAERKLRGSIILETPRRLCGS
jgi:hypothetical protein